MATISERKGKRGTRFRAQVRLQGGEPVSATFTRKSDAKQWALGVEAAIREGRFARPTESRRRTLGEAIDRYLAEVSPQRPRSAREKARHLGWWKRGIGGLLLAEVTPAVLAVQRDNLAKGRISGRRIRSGATTNRYLGALSHVFSIAVREWEWADENPCRRVSRRREPRGRVRFLSVEERRALMDACRRSPDRRLFPIVAVAITTGARQGEILSLRWVDVDLERQVAVVQDTKNGDRRGLPLVGVALQAISALAHLERTGSQGKIFDRLPGGAAFPRRAWMDALREAKIRDFRFHDLRHTAASYLAMSGATLSEIAEVLGHRTLQMVKRYSHLSPQHVSEVVKRMAERFLT